MISKGSLIIRQVLEENNPQAIDQDTGQVKLDFPSSRFFQWHFGLKYTALFKIYCELYVFLVLGIFCLKFLAKNNVLEMEIFIYLFGFTVT